MREDLRDAVRRSRTLDERLATARAGERSSPTALARFERWARYLASGNQEVLLRRLSWDAADHGIALSALEDDGGGDLPSEEDQARFRFLEEAIAGLHDRGLTATARLDELRRHASDPLPPFAVFATALVQPAARRLQPLLLAARFSELATAKLELAAVRAIASLLQHVLYERFAALRGTRNVQSQPGGAVMYNELASRLLRADTATDLFAEFAAAARGVDLLIAQYERNAIELLSRLTADRGDLELLFTCELGVVADLTAGKSDRHEGGRQVAFLHFSGGIRVVYKPRPVALFAAFHHLVEWCGERGLDPAPPALRVLARETWGWIELAVPAESHDPATLERYFTRAGVLLFLAWLTSARDLHMENVVASAGGPILIDLDVIAAPEERGAKGGTFDNAQNRIARSALATGLLSFSQTDPEGRVYEAGGLCGTGDHLSAIDAPVWCDDGNDALHLDRERRYGRRAANVVMTGGAIVRAEDRVREIVRGFRAAYDFARTHRHDLLSERGPLDAFRHGATRVIFRPSEMYDAIQARLVTAPFLRDGIEPSLVAETLNRVFVNETTRPRLWPLARDERRDLLSWDVPLFHAGTDSVDLVSRGGEVVPGWFARSGFSVIRERVGAMSEEDRDLQCELISSALVRPSFLPAGDRPLPSSQPLPPETALAVAVSLSGILWSRRLTGDDGGATWIGSRQLRMDERTDRGVSYYLYDGSPGIALFFGALHAVSGDERQRERAEACMRPLDAVLRSPHAGTLLRGEGIGGANGLGSIVVALTHLHHLTGDSRYLDRALAAARFISADRIARDRRLDIEGGAAGALSALLLLFAATGQADILDQAGKAAGLLAATAVEVGSGVAWPGAEGALLAGYAHGAAGIAAALARLGATTGRETHLDLARRALIFERSVFDRERRNWPVLLHEPPVFMSSWCHGAAGGVLARLAMRDAIGGPEIDADIEAALEHVLAGGAATVDHLCCGTMGRVDALVTAAVALRRPEHLTAARALAAAVVDQARSVGGFALLPPPHDRIFEAGLFRGLSGIGYELLRVAHPEKVPSILTFGAPAPARTWSDT